MYMYIYMVSFTKTSITCEALGHIAILAWNLNRLIEEA